ncbi:MULTISPECIES: hypothetical protein [Aeromonas]|uniref:hypothetical protein n=1 Tax=Aeromonas TaxID=642 RepID=UPI0013177B39|nr:hypothetical protein [Aeromonas jandaei]QHB80770.1 hypothetical protein GIS01_00475 [Aeromonas veronii]QKF97811.1 hypothetical protein HQK30_00835 [Aeromonas hydrophila]QWL67751.1 hypothetical protein HQ398_17420 [Aeromonas jandaei]
MENKLSKRDIILTSLITASTLIIAWLVMFHFIATPSFLKYIGIGNVFSLVNPNSEFDPMTSHMVGELAKQGTIVSLDDIWSYQSNLYQTIITFLIAINGLLAALAIFYIKTSSNEKAIEAVHKYINGIEFDALVNKRVKKKLSPIRDAYEEDTQRVDDLLGLGSRVQDENIRLSEEFIKIKEQLTFISDKIAKMDKADDDGKELHLMSRK